MGHASKGTLYKRLIPRVVSTASPVEAAHVVSASPWSRNVAVPPAAVAVAWTRHFVALQRTFCRVVAVTSAVSGGCPLKPDRTPMAAAKTASSRADGRDTRPQQRNLRTRWRAAPSPAAPKTFQFNSKRWKKNGRSELISNPVYRGHHGNQTSSCLNWGRAVDILQPFKRIVV